MALLRTSLGQEVGPVIRGERVLLRPAQLADYAAWAQLRAKSRDHLTPWEPQWMRDELSRSAFRRRVRHYNREAREDTGYAFLIFDADTGVEGVYRGVFRAAPPGRLVGGLTLSNVRRGVTQAATLGYWLGADHTGRGYMSATLAAVVPFAFDVLGLHRLEAAIMPTNQPSLRVIERAGFRREGLARGYLKIDGRWQDHLLYALLAGDGFAPTAAIDRPEYGGSGA